MEKLNLSKKHLYEIEVNDNGDTIVFDTNDLELPFKFNDAIIEIEKIQQYIKGQEVIISKKPNEAHGVLTTHDEELRKLYKNSFAKMRKAMDMFLGEGGCQKIFGDRNYLSMFDDLAEALQPHLEKMGMSINKSIESIEKKYGDNDGDVLE